MAERIFLITAIVFGIVVPTALQNSSISSTVLMVRPSMIMGDHSAVTIRRAAKRSWCSGLMSYRLIAVLIAVSASAASTLPR